MPINLLVIFLLSRLLEVQFFIDLELGYFKAELQTARGIIYGRSGSIRVRFFLLLPVDYLVMIMMDGANCVFQEMEFGGRCRS